MAAQVTAALDRGKVERAQDLVESSVRDGRVESASLLVEHGDTRFEKVFGRATPGAPFLIASITKPMTAAGVMRLVERGKLRLDEPAAKYLPGFEAGERGRITIRHLLTHTSGLPDMLPENSDLRQRHAPLSEFVALTLKTPLLFSPGTKVSYQSMGILLASEIVQRIDGRLFPKYLAQEIFAPLQMAHTALGMGTFRPLEVVRCQTEHADPGLGNSAGAAAWDWNSPYWRGLGAPWGGAHSTARDVARFLRSFLHPAGKPLGAATCRQMVQNQNGGLQRPWGIGWSLGPGLASGGSAGIFGHGGSTGTLCWADPDKNMIFVLLTSLPERVSGTLVLHPAADLVSSAV